MLYLYICSGLSEMFQVPGGGSLSDEKMKHSGRTKLLKGRNQTEHLGTFLSVQEAGSAQSET